LTVYEYCINEVNFNTDCARMALTKSLAEACEKDAQTWKDRANSLTVEDGGKDIDDVIFWRIFEELDK
jgi:hypothetical protein